jgi:hypothetical protein
MLLYIDKFLAVVYLKLFLSLSKKLVFDFEKQNETEIRYKGFSERSGKR